jgi:hypothetical protein
LNEVFLYQIYVTHDIQFDFVKTHVHLLSFRGLDDFEFDFETLFEEYLKYLYILIFGDKITPTSEGKKKKN